MSRKADEKNLSLKNSSMIRLAMAVIVLLGALLASPAAYAVHPLITDDAGTVGKGKGQVEIGSQIWRHKDSGDEFSTNRYDGGETAMVMTLGLHDRIDLAVAVPYLWWSMETNGNRISSADGISDTILAIKWRFFDSDGWGLALRPGVVLATGDEERDLGSGRTAYHLFFITSKEIGPVACHLNLGYIRNENNAGDHQDIWHTSLAGEYEVIKNLKIVANIGTTRNPASDSVTHPGFALGGIVYAISDRISVDGGVKVGLNKAETAITYLFGITVKF